MGTPKYGNTFLENLYTLSGGAFPQQWSVYMGDFISNKTSVYLGTYNSALLGSNLTWYNVTPGYTTWTLNSTAFKFNNHSFFNQSETALVHFNVWSSVITLPTTTYAKVTANLTSLISGLVCNSSFTGGCYYNGMCDTIETKLTGFKLMFSGNDTYNLNHRLLLNDNANLTCFVSVVKSTTNKYIDLGAPFFMGFYTVFNVLNKQIGIA